MEAETTCSYESETIISQRVPFGRPSAYGLDSGIEAEEDDREIGEGIDEFGDVGGMGIVVLAPVNSGRMCAPV
jgi:hypothetical protein